MRRKLSSFFSSSKVSSRPTLYLDIVAPGVICENTWLISSPGRLPLASIRRSMSSSLRLRVHRLMKPWFGRPSAWSWWKSTGVIVRIRFFTRSGYSAA